MSDGPVWPGISGKRALVTGGSRGIGRVIAAELARSGAGVIVTGRTDESGAATVEAIRAAGGNARSLGLDLSAPDQAAQVLDRLAKETKDDGGVPLVVLNAGMTRDRLMMRMSLGDWTEVLQANLTGAFQVTRALLPAMIRNRFGRIVAITSVVGRMGNAGQANYAASKAGLIGFVRSLAREVTSSKSPRNITVNAVAPGFIETDMTRELPDEAREKLLDLVPLGRLGRSEDVAAAVLFLLSDAASYITGEVLDVNGGMDM
jgi:3-oxoacyl-[acyl-carrier protein] reductase